MTKDEKIAELEEEIRQLKELLAPDKVFIDPKWGLTAAEIVTYKSLAIHNGMTVPYETLIQITCRHAGFNVDDPLNSIAVRMSALRRKVPNIKIISVWKVGYYMEKVEDQ